LTPSISLYSTRGRDTASSIAFAAHVLEQDGEVQLAAPVHDENVGILGVLDTQRDVLEQFALQALADLAAGHVLAFAAGERRGVDHEVHGQRRLVDLEQRQRIRVLGSQSVVPMLTSSMPFTSTMSPASA
jgi:hypothetical protein